MPIMPAFQVKIVGDFCNLRCQYCRNQKFEQNKATIMEKDVLENFFQIISLLPQKTIRVCWHGGEPLLAGLDFFEEIISCEKELADKQFVNSVQTNATLVTSRWAEFFVKNHFRIGVSMDGSKIMHDMNRINILEKGSYDDTMKGVKILREYGVNPGSICTITKKTISLAREGFLSLVENGFTGISFNAFYNTASNTEEVKDSVSDKEWAEFLRDIFDSWLEINNPKIQIREIDQTLALIEGRVPNFCTSKGTCANWFVIDWDGSIYPCERLGHEISFGNIACIPDFSSILENPKFINWQKQIKILPDKCFKCSIVVTF